MLKWIDRMEWVTLGVAAVVLGILPPGATPHLVEKLGMLADGTLVRPIDIFDLMMHGLPSLLLIVKGVRLILGHPQGRAAADGGEGGA